MYRVLEDLDVDTSRGAIEGMSELNYKEPLNAVRCNERSRAFPEDARKMVELLKVHHILFSYTRICIFADMGISQRL